VPAKPAKFPTAIKLGGDVTYSGRTLELSPDGTALLYGDTQSLFRIHRGEKALQKVDSKGQYLLSTACALDATRAVIGFPSDEAGPHLDVCDARTTLATYRMPEEAALHGCAASLDAECVVGWGWDSIESKRLQLWWWPLGAAAGKPVTHQIAPSGMVNAAAFADGTLFVTADDKLYSATASKVAQVKLASDLFPGAVSGARAGSRLVVRSGKRFVSLTTDGKALHAFPPILKVARMTADGTQVVAYGEALRHQQAPTDVVDAYPEWLKTDFIARFDSATGERLGWGEIADSVDLLAIQEGEFVVTKSVKRLAFHPWKLVESNK
jgi:hypothetical protein